MRLSAAILLTAATLLGGCAGTNKEYLPTPQYTVVQPPANFYKCPSVDAALKGIKPEELTDNQVATLLNRLAHDNKTCAQSLATIRSYLSEASKTYTQ
jgi:PBP1b-binding outer membrane lipoprotein LpoB